VNKHRKEIAATEAELVEKTREIDELHHDVGVPALREGVAAWSEEIRTGIGRPHSRRLFLLGAGGVVAGGAALAALMSTPGLAAAAATSGSGGSSETSNAKGGIGGLSGDLAVVALAASLENLAVFAYTSGIAAATAGKLGAVPPAVVTFAQTAMAQHSQHAQAWNSLLTAGGKTAVTVTEPTLTPTVQAQFAKVTDVTGLAQLALELENVAAQTYQAEASKLKSTKAIATAATIQPVEMQHAAILYFVLGMYPGVQDAAGNPLAFNPTTMAA
jgi:hypothetical protein